MGNKPKKDEICREVRDCLVGLGEPWSRLNPTGFLGKGILEVEGSL